MVVGIRQRVHAKQFFACVDALRDLIFVDRLFAGFDGDRVSDGAGSAAPWASPTTMCPE